MQLSELYLNRYLYKDTSQDSSTKDSVFQSVDSSTDEPASIPSGGAAQDINTGNVMIDGAQLEPGTYPVTVLDVSNWGWGQTCTFVSTDANTVTWGSGTFTSASGVSYSISTGNTGNMVAKTYIYLDLLVSETAYQITTTSSDSVGIGKVLVAVANPDGISATYNMSEATQIVGDNILANSINASKITTGQLIVGTNVGLGTAQDSSGVTTIIGNTVTTGFVNALSITVLGTVTAGTLIGMTIKTSTTGDRVEISNDEIRAYDSSGILRAQLSGDSLYFSNSSGNSVGYIIGDTSSISLFATANNGIAILSGSSTGSGAATLSVGGSTYFTSTSDLNISYKDLRPSANNTYECGTSSYKWYNVESMRFTLNGTTITSWPSAGTTTLSGLSIDTTKNWGGYTITNTGGIQLTGVGDSFDCNDGYVDNARAIFFETGRTTNQTADGSLWYHDSPTGGLRVCFNGWTGQLDATEV